MVDIVWYLEGLAALSSLTALAGGLVFLRWGLGREYALAVVLSYMVGVAYTLAYWGWL